MSETDCDKLIADLRSSLALINSVRVLLSRDSKFTAEEKEAISYKTPEELLVLLADMRCSQIKAMVDVKRREREAYFLRTKEAAIRAEGIEERARRCEEQFGYTREGAEPHPSEGYAICKRCGSFRNLTTNDTLDNQFCRSCESTMVRFADCRMEPIPLSDASKLLAATEPWRAITVAYH